MLEIPEAVVLSNQIYEAFKGARIVEVVANKSPHKLAWYFGDPKYYGEKLMDLCLTSASAVGGQVDIQFGNMHVALSDGVNIRAFALEEKLPQKHQLLLSFDNGMRLVFSVQMYGGILVFEAGENQNPYYIVAQEKPSPLSLAFDEDYFRQMILSEKPSLSLKALLATEQRIPGLGNGVLQDILYEAHLHPKRKLASLSSDEKHMLYKSIKETLGEMVRLGGRNTEKDLYGKPCGYITKLCSKSHREPCYVCGDVIHKESYMGGSIYFCETCQKGTGE